MPTPRPKTDDTFCALTNIRYLDELPANDWKLCDGAYYVGDGVYLFPNGTWASEDEEEG